MKKLIETPELPGQLHMLDPIFDGPLSTNYRFYWTSPEGKEHFILSLNPRTMCSELLDECVKRCCQKIKLLIEQE